MNNKKTAKPRALKPSIKRLIVTRAIAEKSVPREYLANQLIKEIRSNNEVPPSLETAKRYISTARNTDNLMDSPWSLGACQAYPHNFPENSIPFLFSYVQNEHYMNRLSEYYQHPFSIRKAIWIVRLKSIIGDHVSSNSEDITMSVISDIYCSAELASEAMGDKIFDSTELDSFLVRGDFEGILQYYPKAKKKKTEIVNSKPIDLQEDHQ